MAKQVSKVEAVGLIVAAGVVIAILAATQGSRDEAATAKKNEAAFERERAEAQARDELAARQRACREGSSCTSQGRCAAAENSADVLLAGVDDGCIAVSESDCAAAAACRALGWCSLNEGVHVCYIAAADCLRTEKCAERGMCSRDVDATAVGGDHFDRVCIASEMDCLRPEMKARGLRCWAGTVCLAPIKGRCPR